MEKAKKLSEKIINSINDYVNKYMSEDGKFSNTQNSIFELNDIIESGFVLYKYVVEKGIADKYPVISGICNELQKYIDKLNTNDENAKKLNMESAIQIWQQAKIVIAFLASTILDIKEEDNVQAQSK